MKSMNFLRVLIVLFCISAVSLYSQLPHKYELKSAVDSKGYKYEYVTNDPLKARIYTLDNGLKIYLKQNFDEPRIQTYIAVKAGSTYDPHETTGLAHYLEHMMFKGSHKIGTTDWEKESKYIKELSDLFEKHRNTSNATEKASIYKLIDSVSQVAAQYAVPSEYDKLISGLGAKGTNAYTSNERTVYINDIPANELERWLMIESERFSSLVLRLFHTELETVYEEFNMYQDRDGTRAYNKLSASLFPTHPYGTQTVIGDPEHLKNPSMVNIHNYWNTYYVPNNMAVCMAGDLNFEETVTLIDKYFGKSKRREVPKIEHPKEEPIEHPIRHDVFGPNSEFVTLAFRTGGVNSPDKYVMDMMGQILYNREAGLIDLNLIQKQQVLTAAAYTAQYNDYGMLYFYGEPREGQPLESVADLMLAELNNIKNGNFDEGLLEAIVNRLKLNRIRSEESNRIAHTFVGVFTSNDDWVEYCKYIDEMSRITKEDVMRYASENFGENYVAVFKRSGKDENVVKVDKPQITAISMNRDNKSEFFSEIMKFETPRLSPVFISFKDSIKTIELSNGIKLNHIKNHTNELFSLYYVLDMGSEHDLKFPLAVEYLPYIGTDKYSPEELSKEFFRLGISMGVSSGKDQLYIYISGLESGFERGLELLEHILANAKPDQMIFNNYIEDILKSRRDAKLDQGNIMWGGLMNFGIYGKKNPFTHIISENDLRNINPEELTDIIKGLSSYKHYGYYYGKDLTNAKKLVEKYHKIPKTLKDYPKQIQFVEQDFKKSEVYFVHFDMVQTNILLISKDSKFDKSTLAESRLFNEYFGSGLSSVVFQELRESRALGYSAFASYTQPTEPHKPHLVYAYLGTQPDKLSIATDAFLGLLNEMPKAEKQFELSKTGMMKKIESERITKSSIFWNYRSNKKLGFEHDTRKDIYDRINGISINDLDKFFNSRIKGKKFTYLLIGNRDKIDFELLKQFGEVKELTLEEIFNY